MTANQEYRAIGLLKELAADVIANANAEYPLESRLAYPDLIGRRYQNAVSGAEMALALVHEIEGPHHD